MEKRYSIIKLISILVLWTIVTSIFVAAFTYAGNSQKPDATATYTQNRITWDVPTNSQGVAKLGIFGEPKEGEELPLIDPTSDDIYRLRIFNNVRGSIAYSVYMYTSNPHKIPLVFEINENVDKAAHIPNDLADKQIVASFGGELLGREQRDFPIHWYWDSEGDAADTEIGNKAVANDLRYDLNVRIVIEDYNAYDTGSGGGGGGAAGINPTDKGDSDTWMLHRSYIKGYPEGDFRPDNEISRAEVSAIFARILKGFNEDALNKTATIFNDTPKGEWYIKYVSELQNTKVVEGYEDGSFRPDNPITRAEFAAVIVRYFEKNMDKINRGEVEYNDLSEEHWAVEYIEKAGVQGLMEGYPNGGFRADYPISRAEVVTAVNRMLRRYADAEYIDNNLRIMKDVSDVKDKAYWAYYEIFEAANSHYTRYKNYETGENWQEVLK